ncbi:MAG: UvrD-helicase domain-containing protein [Bacteroidales bacterium]|nr:UvrD-helicase domain-containing protein [Bacteroidales bacterium]
MTEHNLKIYDASAGSGKTFNLAANYIVTSLIDGFSTVLAVTFTNAAAKEMKDRIIDVLNGLAGNAKDSLTEGYRQSIKELYFEKTKTLLSDQVLCSLSSELLKKILHQYSFFNVCTIDSFFQSVLKNLTRELGVTDNYLLGLDSDKYDSRAVHNLLTLPQGENAVQKDRIVQWAEDFFAHQSQDGKSWNIEKELTKFSSDAFASDFILSMLQGESKQIFTPDNLENLKNTLEENLLKFRKTLSDKCKAFFDKCKQENLTIEDFKGKSRGSFYAVVMKKFPDNISENILDGKTYPDAVAPQAEDIVNFLHENYTGYLKNKIFFNSIYPLGLLSAIASERSSLLKQDNMFLLKDTSFFLDKISQSDVLFVFEKLSQYIKNIFIDEFQDTNRSSFSTLSKIIRETLDLNGSASIFGDIKQSIYRFNGGDFTIMRNLTDTYSDCVINLSRNFRSSSNIVRFNNDFFAGIYPSMKINYVPQQTERTDVTGEVRLRFAKEKNDHYSWLNNEIDYYTDVKGYKLSDIAVLFRSNSHLLETADMLSKETRRDYNPVSDIAFKFSSSFAVNKIIHCLKFLADGKKQISKEIVFFASDNEETLIRELKTALKQSKSLTELVIAVSDILQINDDTVFLPAFYDAIRFFSSQNISSLNAFLEYWDETLSSKSVDMQGAVSGVRLTSIHKSKGLAYPVVIVPYCDNAFFKSGHIWVKTKEGDGDLPFFTANCADLENIPEYCGEYLQEKQAQFTDTVNLLYVAFTRPRNCLSVISTQPTASSLKGEVKSVNRLLYDYAALSRSECFKKEEENLFVYMPQETDTYKSCGGKTDAVKGQSETDAEEITVQSIPFTKDGNAFALSVDKTAENYFENNAPSPSKQVLGSRYHAYISRIRTLKDKDAVISQAAINNDDSQTLEHIVNALLSQPLTASWFSEDNKIFNERSILIKDNEGNITEKRPDRIVVTPSQVTVVDYKFGQPHSEYISQVSQYMECVKEMNFAKNKTLKGYLCYIDIENISIKTQEIELK